MGQSSRDIRSGTYIGPIKELVGEHALIHIDPADETKLTAQFDKQLLHDNGKAVVRLDLYWHPFATADFQLDEPENWDEEEADSVDYADAEV